MMEMHNDPQATDDVTGLLRRWAAGEEDAAAAVIPLLYDELHRIAARAMLRERRDHTLQPTAIVHEAWIQLCGKPSPQGAAITWQNRTHFLGVAARVMRQVLVDHSRARGATKRGGKVRRVPLPAEQEPSIATSGGLIALDDALCALETIDPTGTRIVELRFFGGFTIDETAAYLGLSRKAVVRRWRRVRAWLHSELVVPSSPSLADRPSPLPLVALHHGS